MPKNKKRVFPTIIVLLFLPVILLLSIPGLLKHIFYTISILTESIGDWFAKIDLYLGSKSTSFFRWVNK